MTLTLKKKVCMMGLLLTVGISNSYAREIIIKGQKIIDTSTTYSNDTLDLTQGSLLVTNNATLKLINMKVKGIVSPNNPVLIKLNSGRLDVRYNQFDIIADNILPQPNNPTTYQVFFIKQGSLSFIQNNFKIDKTLRVALLNTSNEPTNKFLITGNFIKNFHGAIFLTNSNNAYVARNRFFRVSLSNIFSKVCSNNVYENNSMLFSDNNGIDIIDSHDILFRNNYIGSSGCYSLFILRSRNIQLDHNKVFGGITYAAYVAPSIGTLSYLQHLKTLVSDKIKIKNAFANSNIAFTSNYFSQNRYGITTIDVDGLKVENNIFVQKFRDDSSRKFWTDNKLLLNNTVNVTWKNNKYKEAYCQDSMTCSNSLTSKYVNFPREGGVNLSSQDSHTQ